MVTPFNRKTLVCKLIICLIPIISVKLAQNSKGCHHSKVLTSGYQLFLEPTISNFTVRIIYSSPSYYVKKTIIVCVISNKCFLHSK